MTKTQLGGAQHRSSKAAQTRHPPGLNGLSQIGLGLNLLLGLNLNGRIALVSLTCGHPPRNELALRGLGITDDLLDHAHHTT